MIIYLHQVEKVNDACQWLNNYFAMCSNFEPSKLTPQPPLWNRSKQSPFRTHLLISSAPQRCRAALRENKGGCKTFQISSLKKKPHSTANDKAAVLCVVITSSLDWEFLFSVQTFCSLISELARLCCDFIAWYRSVKRKADGRDGRLRRCQRLCVGRVESCWCCICWLITGKGQEAKLSSHSGSR